MTTAVITLGGDAMKKAPNAAPNMITNSAGCMRIYGLPFSIIKPIMTEPETKNNPMIANIIFYSYGTRSLFLLFKEHLLVLLSIFPDYLTLTVDGVSDYLFPYLFIHIRKMQRYFILTISNLIDSDNISVCKYSYRGACG